LWAVLEFAPPPERPLPSGNESCSFGFDGVRFVEDAQRQATQKEQAMGDKGGKKDKSKSQKQKDQKQQQKVKSGPDKQQTRKP